MLAPDPEPDPEPEPEVESDEEFVSLFSKLLFSLELLFARLISLFPLLLELLDDEELEEAAGNQFVLFPPLVEFAGLIMVPDKLLELETFT